MSEHNATLDISGRTSTERNNTETQSGATLPNHSNHSQGSSYMTGWSDEESSSPVVLETTLERQSSEELSLSEHELSDSEQQQQQQQQQLQQEQRIKTHRDPRLDAYDEMTEVQRSCLNFAMEHRIFLKAILGLLAERDKKATEIGMNDPNTLKFGPLKKASHLLSGVWKIKFVEIRRGMFSYYEDVASSETTSKTGGEGGGGLLQKNLPLDATICSCRPVKIHRNGLNMAAGGAIFELKIDNTRRLWLAKSRAERLAWIQAINDAMVGGSVTQGGMKEQQHGKSGTVNRRSPFQKDLKQYLKTKSLLNRATTKMEYITAIRQLLGSPLEIPVQWLMEQMEMRDDGGVAFHEVAVASGIEQLWRDLLRDTVRINGEYFNGDSGHGPDKIIASLSRNIVSFSRSSQTTAGAKYTIPESRAISYARDILLSLNRTRSGGDSYFCIDTLCKNPHLIVTVPSSREAEPLTISVEADDSEDPTDYSVNDRCGWIRTRHRLQKSWRKRFFVLSEGILSLYRNASPRPHGLCGQTDITGASIVVSQPKEYPGNYAIYIDTKDGIKDRWFYFTNKFKLLQWAYAFELTSRGTKLPQSLIGRIGLRSPKESKVETSLSEEQQLIEDTMRRHAAQIGVSTEEFDERIAQVSAKNNSNVKVSVYASTEYNICTTDPQGDGTDQWATVSAHFLQTFRISGDRIVRGEEVVRVQLTTCLDPAVVSGIDANAAASSSSSSPRKKLSLMPVGFRNGT